MTTTLRATWRGQLLAQSDRTLVVDGYRYFPRESVRMDLLRPTPKTADDRLCPHGVQFYDVVTATGVGPRAAWSYEAPGPAMKPVDHWFGFWEDVEVR